MIQVVPSTHAVPPRQQLAHLNQLPLSQQWHLPGVAPYSILAHPQPSTGAPSTSSMVAPPPSSVLASATPSIAAQSPSCALPPSGPGMQVVVVNKPSNLRLMAANADLWSRPPTNNNYLSTIEFWWLLEFKRHFDQYLLHGHDWNLLHTGSPPDRWRVFKDSAKVRFSCKECGHGWTTMKGRVIFWFYLNYSTNLGYVMFKLFGQRCNKCANDNYEHPMWYPEEVTKVIGNVYNRVGQMFYGFQRPALNMSRREGKPKNQHNAELCQACQDGLCKGEWFFD